MGLDLDKTFTRRLGELRRKNNLVYKPREAFTIKL